MSDAPRDNGIVRIRSAFSGPDTMKRLQASVREHGLTIFCLVSFSSDALRVGISMPYTEMLVFGSPRAGSPVILAAPSAALDLPLRVLVSAEQDGTVWMAFNDPRYLQTRHHIPPELVAHIGGVGKLLDEVASAPMHPSPAVLAP